MARVLFLAHRLPYPPNKGDKIHSFHVLQHLAAKHDVLLGTFIDEPSDEQFVPQVRQMCKELHVSRISRHGAMARSLVGLVTGEPLSQRFYRDESMAAWVRGIRRAQRADIVMVYSSTMAQYARGFDVPAFVDFGDIDSVKWAEYASTLAWPLSWLYRREARELHRVEREAAAASAWSFFATEPEAEQFRHASPDVAARVAVLGNGVDAEFFCARAERPSPFARGESALVFTGAMNYWPNVDAVTWFSAQVLPALRARWPQLCLYIVGRSPNAAVRALASDTVRVTGTVDDVRPYLQHAVVVVAPLRVGRGVPNKVLEGMAMGRPVVTTSVSAKSIQARSGLDLLCADTPAQTVAAIDSLLVDAALAARMGAAGRHTVVHEHSWPRRLEALDQHIAETVPAQHRRADARMVSRQPPAGGAVL
jgi:polysaccharide biosynthesis protein PslH